MPNVFAKKWNEEVREVSERPEFQNIEVQIIDPSLLKEVGEFDPANPNVTKYEGNPVIYRGQGRLVTVRWGVNSEGTDVGNAETIQSIRVQIKMDPPISVRRGSTLTVIDCPDNRTLERYLFTATSDIQSGAPGARTLEFSVSSDAAQNTPYYEARLIPYSRLFPGEVYLVEA